MASTSRRFEARTSATTSARQTALIEADKAKSQGKVDAAKTEETRRTEPITGTVVGYDAVTGSYLIETPDGGTIRAQNLGDGAPAGLRIPVQRFADSQTSTFLTRPSRNAGNSVAEVEAMGQGVVNLLAVETIDIRIDSPENTEYVIAPYQHYAVRIEAIQGVTGGSVTTTPAVGEIASVGDPISITVTDSGSSTPLLASILLRRV